MTNHWDDQMQYTYLQYVNMFVSQLIHSGMIIELRVEQLVTATVALADSNMIMQLCRPYWEMKNLQQCA